MILASDIPVFQSKCHPERSPVESESRHHDFRIDVRFFDEDETEHCPSQAAKRRDAAARHRSAR
jgi:hypothetical protein